MNQFEKNSLYWVLAILIIVIAPIIVLLTPAVLSTLVFVDSTKIAFITFGKNLVMYFLAFFIAFIALVTLYFIKKLITKIIVIILSILGFLTVYGLGLNYYVYLNEDYVEYNPLFGKSAFYEWSELTHVSHIYPENVDEKEIYIFTFKDGYSFEFEANGFVDYSVKNQINKKAEIYEVPIERHYSGKE